MKLPGITYGPVQALGRHDVAAQQKHSASMVRLAGSIGDSVEKVYTAYDDNQTNLRVNEDSRKLNDLNRELVSTQSYTPDDLTERGIEYRSMDTEVLPNGTIQEIPRKAIPASEVNEAIYNKAVKNLVSTSEGELSNRGKQIYAGTFGKEAVAVRESVLNDVTRKSVEYEKGKILEAAQRAVESGDYEAATSTILDSTVFPEHEKQTMARKLHHDAAANSVNTAIQSKDPFEMEWQKDIIDDIDYVGPLTLKERQSMSKSLDANIEIAKAEDLAAFEEEKANQIQGLQLGVSRGTKTYTDIEAEQDRGLITVKEETRLKMQLDRVLSKKKGEADNAQIVAQSLASGVGMSPINKDDRNAVDAYYKKNPGNQSAMNLAVRTNILPTKLLDQLSSDAFAGSSKRVIESANFMNQLVETGAGYTAKKVPTEMKAVYSTALNMVNNGTPLDDAVNIARKLADVEPEQKSYLLTKYRDEETTYEETASSLESLNDAADFPMDVQFWSDAEMTPAQVQTFGNATQSYYTLNGGKLPEARKAAYRDFRRTHAASEMSDKYRIMRHSPEVVTGQPVNLLMNSLNKLGRDNGITNDIWIESDAVTDRTLSSWQVYFTDPETDLPVAATTPEGLALRWTPNTLKMEEDKRGKQMEKAKEAQEYIEFSRANRARRLNAN